MTARMLPTLIRALAGLALASSTGCGLLNDHQNRKIPQYGIVDPCLPRDGVHGQTVVAQFSEQAVRGLEDQPIGLGVLTRAGTAGLLDFCRFHEHPVYIALQSDSLRYAL